MPGIDCDGLAILFYRVVGLSLRGIDGAEIVMSLGKIGIVFDRGFEFLLSCRNGMLPQQRGAQVVVALGIPRPVFERQVKLLNRFVRVSCLAKRSEEHTSELQ